MWFGWQTVTGKWALNLQILGSFLPFRWTICLSLPPSTPAIISLSFSLSLSLSLFNLLRPQSIDFLYSTISLYSTGLHLGIPNCLHCADSSLRSCERTWPLLDGPTDPPFPTEREENMLLLQSATNYSNVIILYLIIDTLSVNCLLRHLTMRQLPKADSVLYAAWHTEVQCDSTL